MRAKISILLIIILSACTTNNFSKVSEETEMNKQKVVELLKSIETGSHGPIEYINPDKYIQHNQAVSDGLEGFGAVLKQLPENSAKVNTVRVFADGEFVVTHTEYNFFGPKVGFDIFRFENGLIVEHWDNLQEIATETESGRSQIDGLTEIKDLDRTDENKELVANLIRDVFLGAAPEKITEYISVETYFQHNPTIADGLDSLGLALKELNEAGTPIIYNKNHIILGEGNFVLAVSEGIYMNNSASFYDLFRIEDGLIVEHWDVIESIIPESEAQNGNGKFNF